MSFTSQAVPFVDLGNGRVGLTDLQLCEDPHLEAFVKRFPRHFTRHELMCAWIYHEKAKEE